MHVCQLSPLNVTHQALLEHVLLTSLLYPMPHGHHIAGALGAV